MFSAISIIIIVVLVIALAVMSFLFYQEKRRGLKYKNGVAVPKYQ